MFPLLEESAVTVCSFFGSLSNWKRMSSSIHKNKKKDPILQQQQQQQPSTGQQRAPFRLSQQILLLSCKNSFSFIAAAAARVSIWLTRVAGKKNDQLFEGFLKLRAAIWWWPWKKTGEKEIEDPWSRIYRLVKPARREKIRILFRMCHLISFLARHYLNFSILNSRKEKKYQKTQHIINSSDDGHSTCV